MELTEKEKDTLLEIAKNTITSRLSDRDIPKTASLTETLREKRGAFVTLKKRGHLRGCIGYIQAVKPLHKTIEEMAIAAAFSDPRFPPLKQAELKDLTFEISVLTPLKEISDIREIEAGVHGIYLVKGFHSGLLLPQVATEYGWDRLTFLEQTCYKAGLSAQAWKDKDAKIYIFSADVFGDLSDTCD